MFFYDFNNLDFFILNTLSKNLPLEIERISHLISLYQSKEVTLLNITNNMITVTSTFDKTKSKDFYKVISLLKKSFEDLENINHYLQTLKNNLNAIMILLEKIHHDNIICDEIKANLIEYNKQDEKLQNELLNFEKSINYVSNLAIQLTFSMSGVSYVSLEDLSETSPSKYILDDNSVLLISEKEQKAYLPYHYSDIKKIYENNKDIYTSLKDVIESLYILPLNRFENSSLSRFREAYQLIRNKENGSFIKALDLGLELMFNYDLNPIVIAACRNLDELDIYLDCLQENELSEFDCFEIKFEIAPKLSNTKKVAVQSFEKK